jgi:hypothetical protein
VLLTGDNDRAARTVASAPGISEVIAGVLSAGKVDAIKMLQDAGRVVANHGCRFPRVTASRDLSWAGYATLASEIDRRNLRASATS